MTAVALSAPDRKLMFGMMSKALDALIPQGTTECRKGMRTMDNAFRSSARAATILALNPQQDEEARSLLRSRCGLCQSRCHEPVL